MTKRVSYPKPAYRFKHIPQQRYIDLKMALKVVYSDDPKDQWAKTWRNWELNHPTDTHGSPCSRVDYAELTADTIMVDLHDWAWPAHNLNKGLKKLQRETGDKLVKTINTILANGLAIKGPLIHD